MMSKSQQRDQNQNWMREESSSRDRSPSRASGQQQSLSYFGPLSSFFSDMDRVFEQAFRTYGLPTLAGATEMMNMNGFRPNVDISATDVEYAVTVEMPGIDEKDVRLDICPAGMLTISGEKRQETQGPRAALASECSWGMFQRSIALPEDAELENVEASFRNGLLTITCPRRESGRTQMRHIPINGGSASRERSERTPANERGQSADRSQSAERGQQQGQQQNRKVA